MKADIILYWGCVVGSVIAGLTGDGEGVIVLLVFAVVVRLGPPNKGGIGNDN